MIQLSSDLHRVFIQFQETLCSTSEDPFKAPPGKDELWAACLKTLSQYRQILNRHLMTEAEDKDYIEQAHSFLFLLQISLARRGQGRIEHGHLESWIDESFPISNDEEDFWKTIYRYTLRRRFDQVCLLLQRLLDDPQSSSLWTPVQVLTDLLLAYPTAKQRTSNPYSLSQWRLEMASRLRLEQISSWDSRLANLVTLLEGDTLPPSVRASVSSWQECFIGRLLLSSKVDVQLKPLLDESIKEKPSAFPVLDSLSCSILDGTSIDYEKLSRLPFIGAHLIDLLARTDSNLTGLRNNVLLAYAETLSSGSLWNLSADYLWSIGTEQGRNRLETLLFDLAMKGTPARQESVIDVCHNFELNILADAIHVMISEEAIRNDQYSKALYHAIEAGQVSLINRICDAILQRFLGDAKRDVSILDVFDAESLPDRDCFPRLALLLSIGSVEKLIKEDKLEEAAAVFSSLLISSSLIPTYLRPSFIDTFVTLCPYMSPLQSAASTRPILQILNETAQSLPPDLANQARLHINRQAIQSFLMN